MPTNGDYSNWNWENQSQSNWKRKDGNIWVEINPPFKPETERIGKIVDVYESGDYTKAKGWQLLWAQFDGIYPYYILYNPHKGLVRAFFFLEEQPFEHVLATLSYHDINSPGILTYGNEYQYATDKYLNSTVTDDDMISVIIPSVFPDSWCSADFPIFFDQNIQNSKYNSKKWVFKFYGCENYQIHLKGQMGPASNEQHTISGSKSGISTNTFDATHSKLHKQLETNDKFMQQMQNSVKNIDTTSAHFLQGYKSLVNLLKPLSQIFSAATGISAGAGAVLGFMKVVNGTFDQENSTAPAAVIQYIELEGTMDISFDLGGNTLKIPGVNGSYFPPVSWDPYDCSMGYINLSKTPSIRKTTPYDKYPLDGDDNVTVYTDGTNPTKVLYYKSYPPFYVKANQPPVSGYLGKFVKYKFQDDNVVAINNIPGLSLIDIHFALVVKLTGTGSEKFDISKKYISLIFWDDASRELHIPVVNPVYKALSDGMLKIYKFDEENDGVYIGTPELPINKLKDMVIEVPEKSEIMLRVIAKFTSSYYDNPIVFQANYKMNDVVENANRSRLVCGWEQTNYHWTDYFTGTINIELTGTNTSTHSAGQIMLNPTFEGNAGFEAVPVDIYPTRGNTQLNYYSFACSSNLKSDTYQDNELSNVSEFSDEDLALFPNPSNGSLTISSNYQSNEIVNVKLINTMGLVIFNENNLNQSVVNLNISNAKPGLHIMQITLRDNKTYMKKVIFE